MDYTLIDFDNTFRNGMYVATGTYKHDVTNPLEKPIRLAFVGSYCPPLKINGFVKEVKVKGKWVKTFDYSKKRSGY